MEVERGTDVERSEGYPADLLILKPRRSYGRLVVRLDIEEINLYTGIMNFIKFHFRAR